MSRIVACGIEDRDALVEHDGGDRPRHRAGGWLRRAAGELQEGRLAGAVRPGERHPLGPGHDEIDGAEDRIAAAIGEADASEGEHRPPGRQAGRWQAHRELADALHRRFGLRQRLGRRGALPVGERAGAARRALAALLLRIEQHLRLVALGAAAHALRVAARLALARRLDAPLDRGDIALGDVEVAFGRGALFPLARGVEVIAAAIEARAEARELDDAVHRAQQRAVVADHDGALLPAGEHTGDGGAAVGIEIVGRLVEQDQVRLGDDEGGERGAGALSAGERRQRPAGFETGETDLGERRRQPRFERPVRFRRVGERAGAGLQTAQAGERRRGCR